MDEILQTFKGLNSLVKTSSSYSGLLFDVAQFKAKKQVNESVNFIGTVQFCKSNLYKLIMYTWLQCLDYVCY